MKQLDEISASVSPLQQLEGPEVVHIYELASRFYIYAQYRYRYITGAQNHKVPMLQTKCFT